MGLDDFDAVSRFYDLLPIPTHPEPIRRRLEGALGPTMDLGGGTGRFTVRMHDRDGEPLLVDASRGMLARARKAGRGLSPIQAVGQALPLPDTSLGAITVTEAFHHFAPHQPAVLAEAARVLRDDGVLLIEEIDPGRLMGRAIELGERLVGFESAFLAPTELQQMAGEVFDEVAIERSGTFTYLLEARVPRPP